MAASSTVRWRARATVPSMSRSCLDQAEVIGSRASTATAPSPIKAGSRMGAENFVAKAAPRARPAPASRSGVARVVSPSKASTVAKKKRASPRSVVTIWPWASTSGERTHRSRASAADGVPKRFRDQRKTIEASTQPRATTGSRPQKSRRSASFQR